MIKYDQESDHGLYATLQVIAKDIASVFTTFK